MALLGAFFIHCCRTLYFYATMTLILSVSIVAAVCTFRPDSINDKAAEVARLFDVPGQCTAGSMLKTHDLEWINVEAHVQYFDDTCGSLAAASTLLHAGIETGDRYVVAVALGVFMRVLPPVEQATMFAVKVLGISNSRHVVRDGPCTWHLFDTPNHRMLEFECPTRLNYRRSAIAVGHSSH